MVIEVSLIIPSQNADTKLHELLSGIPNWERIPNEIIIVDSSEKESIIPKDIELSIKKLNVDLLIIYENNLYPGHARNIGISTASNSVLAFLDTSTQPTGKWLSGGLSLMKVKNSDGVWGKTYYQANTFSSKLIRFLYILIFWEALAIIQLQIFFSLLQYTIYLIVTHYLKTHF